MKRNKLLTGFLVLGMGLSLVACSSNEPETKVAEEKKIEETKAIEEKEEKAKEEKKEEEKAKAAEEEKERIVRLLVMRIKRSELLYLKI